MAGAARPDGVELRGQLRAEGRHPAEVDQDGEDAARAHFGGTLAPGFRIWIDGDRAGLDRG